jgi:hypothetical protein
VRCFVVAACDDVLAVGRQGSEKLIIQGFFLLELGETAIHMLSYLR